MISPQSPKSAAIPRRQGIRIRPVSESRIDARARLVPLLLLLSAAGYLFNNVAIWRLPGFTVDASHILLVLTTVACLITSTYPDIRIVLIWVAFIWLELLHALLFNLSTNMEWIRSVAQMTVYSLAFVIISGFKLRQQDLMWLGRPATKLAWLFGGFAMLQALLLNTIGVDIGIPVEWRATTYAVAFGDYRYQGIARAQGLSREPAELAFGLVVLIAFMVWLNQNKLVARRSALIAIVIALGGLIVTLSPVGLVAATAILLGSWLVSRSDLSSWGVSVLGAIALLLVAYFVTPLNNRLSMVIQGTDVSALTRVEAPFRLLVHIPDNLEFLLLGTGLGLEERDIQTYLDIYQPLIPWTLSGEVRIHNIFAIAKFQQGILGLATYLALLWAILHPTTGLRTSERRRFGLKDLMPMIILIVMYFFSSGYYVSPIHWTLLAFVAILRRVDWSSDGVETDKQSRFVITYRSVGGA